MKKLLLTATVQSHICQFHRALVEMLRETQPNIEIHVAARDNLSEKNGLKLDFADKVFNVPFERSPLSPKNFSAYRQLRRIIDEGDYDVIHCNTPVGGILTRMAANKARKNGTRVIYTAHGFHFYQGAPKKNWMIYYPLERFFAKRTDTLITINEEDFRLAKEKFHCDVRHIHGVGVDDRRYRTGDESEKAALRKNLGLDGRIILCVGELLPNKNQAMAVRSMPDVVRAVPDAQLLLAGNGIEKTAIEALIEELGMREHVRLLGYTLNMEEYQRVSEISVSCSRREGLGLNLIEGMLSGNPVVATRNRGHNELVHDGENGFLIGQNDYDALAERLIELLSDDKKRTFLSENGYRLAQKYSFPSVKKELKEIYYGN